MDDNLKALIFIGVTFLLGVLVGSGLPSPAGAAETVAVLDNIGFELPLRIPEGEELLIGPDTPIEQVVIPSRRARWGRPFNPERAAHRISFTARFSHFPEYSPEAAAPSLRVFDFTKGGWE